MRVLMTTDTLGGVWTYAVDLAKALGTHGVEVVLATTGARLTPDQARIAGNVASMSVIESTYRSDRVDDAWEELAAAGRWLLTIEAKYGPDVVHLNAPAHAALPWRAPVLTVMHSSGAARRQTLKSRLASDEWQRYQAETRRGVQAASLVVAPTRSMLNAVLLQYGSPRRMRVIHNGRDPRLFRTADKQPFVLTVGRLWDEWKNIAALNRVASRLPWPVWVVGEEPCLVGTMENSGLRCAGRLPSAAVADWMGRAAIFALPARHEPFGLAVLEAALSGCALVLGDIPSLREVWDGAAVFVPPHDDAALAATLRALMGNRLRREELERRALNRARLYTHERMARAYLDAYGHVIAAHDMRTANML